MGIRSDSRVADIATQSPATIRVFQRYGIDFCCGGKRALGEVCGELRLGFDELKRDLDLAVAGPRDETPAWHARSMREVVEDIIERYHRPLDEELPRLDAMMEKVLRVHGERHPELADVGAAFARIRDELRLHMLKEEQVLFPYVARLEAMARSGGGIVASPFGSIDAPIAAMEAEHDAVGRTLAALRAHTAGYVAPEDACNTYRGLFHGLAELERGLHEHIHLENNILFPRAARIEAGLLQAARAAR